MEKRGQSESPTIISWSNAKSRSRKKLNRIKILTDRNAALHCSCLLNVQSPSGLNGPRARRTVVRG